MASTQFSGKRLQISKANLTIVIVMSAACFLTVFSLVASRSLLQQRAYQAKVIAKKEAANKQLSANLEARDKLVSQYKAFVENPSNIIGGSSSGSGDRDGDNARIILDALPSKYDFPAVATSFEKLLDTNQMTTTGITGTDDEVAQATKEAETKPAPVEMPFQIAFEGDSKKTQDFLAVLDRSIRPIHITSITISGSDSRLLTNISGKTYYQPGKSLNIQKEVVK